MSQVVRSLQGLGEECGTMGIIVKVSPYGDNKGWSVSGNNVMSLQGLTMHDVCQGDSVDSRCSVIQ